MKMICFNPTCRDASEQFKKAWRCRNGDFAPLCHRCAATFEQGRFCHTFHLDAAGWRNCESCGKPIHCGCIVSIHDYILLDAGGVDCMTCARKKIVMATNQIWPSSFSLPIPDIPKDVSVKNSSQIAAPSGNLGHKGKPFDMWNTSAAQSGLNPRMEYEVDGVNQIPGECSTLVLETKRFEYPYDRVNDLNHPIMNSPNLNASVDMDIGSHSLHRDEMSQNGLQGMTYETDPNTHVNISLRHISLKDGPSNPQFSAVPCLPANKANGLNSFSATQTQHQALSPQVVEQSTANSQNGMDSFGETQKRIGRLQVDPRGRSQLLPRYWPRITDQELQQISGDSNSVITPLFEKMLSASDAGKVGRLVLPKKCAEAYFPTITHSEGLPLKVQDAKGKEWVLNFRFWPNNNSRMYVLEGVTPCIQSMQLQAGDTVTFSRIDPGGKLVMGFRKAASVPPLDQDKQSLMMGSDVSKISEVNASDPAGSWHANDRLKSFAPRRRKPRALGAKSKRLGMEHEDLIELKLTWEEALGLLCPPVDNPNVVVVEGHAFEEYEEAPILGKPTIITTDQVGEKIQWIQCEDCSKWRKLPISALLPPRWTCSANLWDPKRSLCSSAQEVSSKQLEEIVSSSKTASALTKTKPAEKNMGNIEVSEGLNNLANLGEDDSPPSIQTTTRHPRHRIGCTCIVCIQSPIGKGPKHKATCICNVCQAVKRRKLSLMKRKSEKETEFARKKLEQLQLPENPELIDDISMAVTLDPCQKVIGSMDSADDPDDKKLFTPLVGQIDLNIQPEREDAQLPVSCSSNIVKLGSGNHKLFPIWCGKASSAQCDVNLEVNEDDGIEHDLSSGANKGVDPTCISKPEDSSD